MKILIATTNKGKKSEIISLFQDTPFELVFPADLGITTEVEETGATYEENAALKARALCQQSGLLTLADDTGLEVEALDGRPGVHSARYLPNEDATDADRRAKLLSELKDKPAPWRARCICVVALASPDGRVELFEGELLGEISQRESGEYGFGFDRSFWIPQVNKTLADLRMQEKNQISHRAMAVKKVIQRLQTVQ